MNIPNKGLNFRLIEKDELYELLRHLEYFLPESIKFHQTLKTYLQDHVWNFYFYVSTSWPRDPICLHFPGTTQIETDIFSSFGLFCPSNRIDCLVMLRNENVLIDWNKPLYVHYVHSAVMDEIENLYCDIGSVQYKCCGDYYVNYSPNEIEIENLISPRFGTLSEKRVEFRILEKKDAKIIHGFYPANHIESLELFEQLIERFPSYGIFIEGELAAWMLQSYYGAMISMYTKTRFRHLGFGSYIAGYLSKLVAGRGYIPFVLVRFENNISRKLYQKLGFKHLFTNVRGLLKPKSHIY